MEIPLLPAASSPASTISASAPGASATQTTPSQSARTILSTRLPASPSVGRKSSKKQSLPLDGSEAIAPLTGSNVRSVLGTLTQPVDVGKTSQQQIITGGRVISSPAGRKSLMMTSSSGVAQVVSGDIKVLHVPS